MNWKSPIPYENPEFIIGYRIYIHEGRDDKFRWKTYSKSILDGTAISYLVTDLQPNSTYQVEVAALTRAGEGTRSTPITVKTSGDVPSRPTLQIK